MNKILKAIMHPSWILIWLNSKRICLLDDENYLKLRYSLIFNKKIDLVIPSSFNEKMQWLKLHDRQEKYKTMVDKIAVKDYVSKIIGNEYIINNYGIYDKFDDIDFQRLPNKFIIKCNHYGGNNGIVICKDKLKLDKNNAEKRINRILKKNLYFYGREWPYKDIKPKILIEELLDNDGKELEDYKFWCFNGEPKLCLVCTDRNTELKETFFDMNWNLLELKRPNHDIDKNVKKPINFELMKTLSKKLSKDMPFIRVDFYEVNGKVYFGELTFYPASGFAKFEPEEWDEKLGSLIDINNFEV